MTQKERQVVTNFSSSNLVRSDFAGVTAYKGQFKGSALSGFDFSEAISRSLYKPISAIPALREPNSQA